ncbi:DUF2993 domain-containing protein [Streptomyces sp. NPDC002328]|uniref:LmeA family phospholipid-binding protein n=1 Tax=Streptomyces sp. NPDC002328 TaxID=3364642 RepID=UPI0036A35CB6
MRHRDQHPAPRSRRRLLALAGAALLTSALLAFAVDRVVAARVESRTAEAFQEGMGTPRPPEVRVHGFPVLTQTAAGTLRHVDITAHGIPARGTARPLPVTELSLSLDGLRKSDDDSEATARTASATAFLSYPDVSDALGVEISRGSRPGQVGAVVRLPFAAEATATATVSARPGNRIAFTDFRLSGAPLPTIAQAALNKLFERPIPLRNMPDGLTLRTITTTPTGIEARFTGESVTFRPDEPTEADPTEADPTGEPASLRAAA